MKKLLLKAMGGLIAVLPVITMFAVTVSANNAATPILGQPVPPESLKKYRKF